MLMIVENIPLNISVGNVIFDEKERKKLISRLELIAQWALYLYMYMYLFFL